MLDLLTLARIVQDSTGCDTAHALQAAQTIIDRLEGQC